MNKENESNCINTFKNDDPGARKKAFNMLFAKVINALENTKNA